MTSRQRFLASSAAFAFALIASAGGSPASAAPAFTLGNCFTDLYGGEPGHDFGAEGVCHFCYPNTCHPGTWSGTCSGHHNRCDPE